MSDTNGNGAPTLPPVSVLQSIRDEWTKNGGKEPPKATKEAAIKAWQAAKSKVEAAEVAMAAAKKAEWAATEALARLLGARSFRLDGVVYDFANRGSIVFTRAKGGANVVDL